MKYGLPYQGSKNKIAEWVISNLPKAEHFYDLFAGGCAVTHAAMLSGKYQHFHANDIFKQYPQMFLDAIYGLYSDEKRVITRAEFEMYKSIDPYIALCWSFGNNKRDYLWSPQAEKMKIAACKMLAADTLQERRILYLQFMKMLIAELQKGIKLDGLERIEPYERLESILNLDVPGNLKSRLYVTGLDYREVEILPNSVVYCDVPYNTNRPGGYYGATFYHKDFYEWLRQTPFPVYVSEYEMPSDFVSIASKKKKALMSPHSNSKDKIENIFIHKRFLTL